ncbi:MAG: protein kinase [Myxococcales bacterium]|nr:protein kinase [Myxococcales bacterium]
MTIGRDRDDQRSGAGWSEPRGPAPRADAHPFAVDADDRYRDVELAGTGGMGTVMVAHDRRLGREVAVKRILAEPDDTDAAIRLAREAAITARLEHPSIIPIYDAGVGPDGRAYYAMRLVRGRSLAEVLTDATDLAARLALVRPFLAVCQALAYSHRHDVLHRDLKPANIMIGEFGEVYVVDWGLARVVTEPEPEHEAQAGTAAYLAPERARGEPSSCASDVWSLGAILGEVLAGACLMPASRIEILAQLAAPSAPARAWPERCPPELIAIATKALGWTPAERYPDAAGLAADVSAYLDGRRVGAHLYSTAELARRLIHAWRWQVAAVTAGLVAGGVVLALTWSRIAGEQRRAIAAERRATAALVDTTDALAWALDRSAVAALVAGDVAEAEAFAARALAAGESIEARGVLAATRAEGRPQALARQDVAGCARIIPDGATTFVCQRDHELALWDVGAAAPRWRRPSSATHVLGLDGRYVIALERGVAVTILDGADGRVRARGPVPPLVDGLVRDRAATRVVLYNQRDLFLLAPDRALARPLSHPCAKATIDAVAVGRAEVFVVCGDGRAVRIAARGAPTTVAAVPFDRARPASSAALDADERTLAIGGIHGDVALLDLITGTVTASRAVLPEPVRRLRVVGDLVAIAGERGGVHVWGRGLDTELLRLPERAGTRVEVVGDELVTGGTSWWRWRIPAAPDARRFTAPAGLAGAAIAADGSLVVAARGDGRVSLWSTRLGHLRAEPVVGPGVIKRVDIARDGRQVAVAHAGHPGLALIDAADGQIVFADPSSYGAHRVAYLDDGAVAVVPYDAGLTWWSADRRRTDVRTAMFGDAEPTPDHNTLWLLTRDGQVWRARGTALARLFDAPGAIALAPFSDGARVAVTGDGAPTIRARDGRVVTALAGAVDGILDIAVSPDDRWIAAGTTAGTIEVWAAADGRRVAHLRGHQARVAWVGFAAGALWSAGWDGLVLRWDLRALTATAAELIADADATWGLPLLRRAPAP